MTDLKKTFEKRRVNLISILESQDSELDLGKQHQVYGAIKEIENFLRTLDHLNDLEQNSVEFQLRRDPGQNLISRFGNKLKKQ